MRHRSMLRPHRASSVPLSASSASGAFLASLSRLLWVRHCGVVCDRYVGDCLGRPVAMQLTMALSILGEWPLKHRLRHFCATAFMFTITTLVRLISSYQRGSHHTWSPRHLQVHWPRPSLCQSATTSPPSSRSWPSLASSSVLASVGCILFRPPSPRSLLPQRTAVSSSSHSFIIVGYQGRNDEAQSACTV